MGLKKLMLIGLLMAILTIGAVSAADDANQTGLLQDDSHNVIEDGIDSNKLEMTDNDCLSNASVELNEGDTFEIGNPSENTIEIDIESEVDIQGTLSVYIDGNLAYLTKAQGTDEEIYYVSIAGAGSQVTISEDTSLCLDHLAPGPYTIRVVFDGPLDEFKFDKAAKIKVKQKGVVSDITIGLTDNEQYFYGRPDNIINITAPEAIIDNLNITINNQDYSSFFRKLTNTSGYVNISQLGADSYMIIVSGGAWSENATFEVKLDTENPQNLGIIAYPNVDSFYCGALKFISLALPKNATGSLLIKYKNDVPLFNQPLENGYASVSLSSLKVDYYDLIASYTGNDYHVDDAFIQFTVMPIITMPSRMVVGERKYLTVNFVNRVTGTVDMEVDHEYWDYRELYNNNVAVFSLDGLDDGDFDISIVFKSDDGFEFYSDDFHIEIQEVKPRYVGGSNIVMNYGDKKVYKFTIYGRNGRPAEEDEYVEITIGRQTFEASTNSRGVVTFRIPDSVTPGKYKIIVNYDDDVQVKNTLLVKRILKLSKVNVRAFANKLVIKATLKKGMNKKKIIFKFNGKKYTVKTNKKGVAKLVINSKVLNKLKVGKKVKYQATYLKDTVKYTVKVKK